MGLVYAFKGCIGNFSVAVVKHYDQAQLMEETVSSGLWFRRIRVHYGREAWQQQPGLPAGTGS